MSAVLLEKQGAVATVTLNRPEAMNSMNPELFAEALKAFDDVEKDNSVRVVILTGAGKAFCAGGDLAYMREELSGSAQIHAFIALAGALSKKIHTLSKPVIGMINGVAAGAGANLLLACDITFAAASFRFGQSFSKVGVVPDGGGSYFLPRIVGLARAKELMFSGKLIDAETAQNMGLVNIVVADEKLAEKTYEFANELANRPSLALAAIKRTLNQSMGMNLDGVLELEASSQAMIMMTEDAKEGMAAFAERRPPKFTGK